MKVPCLLYSGSRYRQVQFLIPMRVSNEIKTAGNSTSKVRNLKIHSKFREYHSSKHSRTQYDLIPEIELSGFWLEELGFVRGKQVLVITENKRITIELVEVNVEAPLSRA